MQKHEMMDKIIQYQMKEITTSQVAKFLDEYTEELTSRMQQIKKREKILRQLLIGKVSEIIGFSKTVELVKALNEAFPTCQDNESIDPELISNNRFPPPTPNSETV